MYITKCLQIHADNFQPSIEDILEAEALGVEPKVIPDENTVAMLSDNAVVAIGGNQGDRVWFLTSKYVPLFTLKERLEFRKLIVEYRDMMLSRYESIWNFVWVGNKSHIRFLKTIGAVFHNEYTLDGQFQLFTISRRQREEM